MSTTFRTAATDEWVCTRWSRGLLRGAALDFGSEARLTAWLSVEDGVDLEGEDGSETTLTDLLASVGFDVTCGQFCGTVELGSGELLDRLGLLD